MGNIKYPCNRCGKRGSWSKMKGSLPKVFCIDCWNPDYKARKVITPDFMEIGKAVRRW